MGYWLLRRRRCCNSPCRRRVLPGDYLRDDVLRLCEHVCVCAYTYLCYCRCIAPRKMIAILPPRGTYAAERERRTDEPILLRYVYRVHGVTFSEQDARFYSFISFSVVKNEPAVSGFRYATGLVNRANGFFFTSYRRSEDHPSAHLFDELSRVFFFVFIESTCVRIRLNRTIVKIAVYQTGQPDVDTG